MALLTHSRHSIRADPAASFGYLLCSIVKIWAAASLSDKMHGVHVAGPSPM